MLTRKQHELLTFIDRHLTTTGFSPSFEEMKQALGLKSKSGIHRLISALEERGFLQRQDAKGGQCDAARNLAAPGQHRPHRHRPRPFRPTARAFRPAAA